MKTFKHIIAVAVTTTALGIAPAFAAHHENKKDTNVEAGADAKVEGKAGVKPGTGMIKLDETQKADQEPTEHMKEVTDGDKSEAASGDKMAKTDGEATTEGKVEVKPGDEAIELDETQKADQEPTEHMKDVTDGDKAKMDKKAKMDSETEEKEEMKN